MKLQHDERFSLHKTDWRTIVFVREKFGPVICKHYKNTLMFYGQLLITEKGIRYGRYHLDQEQSTDAMFIFKLDPKWV